MSSAPAVDVADRVEPVGAGRAAAVVDRDRLARLEPDRLQAEVRGRRAPPDGDEELVAGRAPAALELDRDTVRVPAHRDRLHPDAHVDARALERLGHLCGGEGLLAREQPRAALEHRHLRAERRERLRHLDADHTPAEDHEPRGNLLRDRRVAVRPGRGLREAGDRRQQRIAADRDDDGGARDERLVADQHAALAVEARLAAHERDAPLLEPGKL